MEEIKQKAREGLDELMTDENLTNYKAHTKTNVYNLFQDLLSQALQKRDEELADSLPENILAEEVLYISPERNILTKEEYDNFMEHYNAVKGYETSVQVYWEYKRV